MSYDISFKVKIQDLDVYIPICECYANITYNVRDIITKSTGLEWNNEQNNGFVKDIIINIENGIDELKINGDNYKQYEDKNGYGTVNRTIEFFEQIIYDWKECKKWKSKELVDVITFWIE